MNLGLKNIIRRYRQRKAARLYAKYLERLKKRLPATINQVIIKADAKRKSKPNDWITIRGRKIPLGTNGEPLREIDIPSNKAKYDTWFLPKQEYAKVMSEINTYYHSRFKGKGRECKMAIGNYEYSFENLGFNEYNIYDKERLK